MTPEQAFELYKANAKMALDVINAAIENTAKDAQGCSSRRRGSAIHAEKGDPSRGGSERSAVAGRGGSERDTGSGREAMQYWQQMFEMIVEMQKPPFCADGRTDVRACPGKGSQGGDGDDARRPAGAKPVKAMQGVMSSGGSAFTSMQRVMGDLTRMRSSRWGRQALERCKQRLVGGRTYSGSVGDELSVYDCCAGLRYAE